MSTIVHRAYVISDLHLGGRFPTGPKDRGFRMMNRPDALASFIRGVAGKPGSTELVINGDFIDFLAEEVDEDEWKPFRDEPGEAVAAFEELASRKEDGEVFDALAALLDAGHRLTILAGNHDLELTWPEVRAAFEQRIWKAKQNRAFNLRWLIDGEALILGDAVIEHGNRYDPANFVDHGRLRRARELRSRRLYKREEGVFFPPVGSRLVAEVMNEVKQEYPFVDLLKPESEPLFGLILAIDPSLRGKLGDLAAVLKDIPLRPFSSSDADPGYRQLVAGGAVTENHRRNIAGGGTSTEEDAALADIVGRLFAADEPGQASAALAALPAEEDQVGKRKVASVSDQVASKLGLLRLLLAGKKDDIAKRLPLLRQAVRALRGDQTFDESVETGKRYLRAARELASGKEGIVPGKQAPVGFRWVIFGHTHHRKVIDLDKEGATYVNTGTWARVMEFPEGLTSKDDAEAGKALTAFVESIRDETYQVRWEPSYARVDLRDDGYVDKVELFTYDPDKKAVE